MSQEYFCAFHNFIKGKYVARSPEFPRFSNAVYSSFLQTLKVPCFSSYDIIIFINEGTEGRKKKEKLLIDRITGLKMDGRNV